MVNWRLSGEAGSGAGTYGDCGVIGCMMLQHVTIMQMQQLMMDHVYLLLMALIVKVTVIR